MTTGEDTQSVRRRTALKSLALGGVSIAAASSSALARPGRGRGRGGGPCDIVVPDDKPTIQSAVDAASPDDSICVQSGTYPEQVIVNKSLTIRSAAGADPTVVPPSAPSSFTIPESGPTWEPMLFAFGGSEQGGSVSGSGTIDVSVHGLTFDGQGSQPTARRKPAILYRNASGSVAGNTVENMGVGGKETFGILAYGDSTVALHGNDVSGYERGGIGIVGDGGAHPSPAADVRGNTVVGSTGIGEAWGPNGIQIGYGASGKVIGNEVRDNRYASSAFTAAGIIIFESDGVQVMGNDVTNSDVGIAVGSWGWFRSTANNVKIQRNTVETANAGVLLRAVASDGFTGMDSEVSNGKVVNNEISDPDTTDDDAGVAVQALDFDPDFDPAAVNNKVIRNSITGFADQVIEEGTDTKLAAIEP